MKKIFQTKNNVTLYQEEGKYYSEDPKAIINALEEDLKSDDIEDVLNAAMLKSAIKVIGGGRIYKLNSKIRFMFILS
jgi:DNA integrity scanning protein DisA with diadenylate cyclase activity